MLEVFNPDRQRWQTHDVGADFYFINADSRQRISAESLLFASHEGLAGCPNAGGACREDLARDSLSYFGALRYGCTYEVWANPDRFDVSARFAGQGNQNLAEYIGHGDARRVTLRLDSWLGS